MIFIFLSVMRAWLQLANCPQLNAPVNAKSMTHFKAGV
jgi:hypothetical protein